MSGWREIFVFSGSEDIKGDNVDLGVTVLSGLGGRHINDLAWSLLDDNETVLSKGRTLHRIGERSTGVGRLEGVLVLQKNISVVAQQNIHVFGSHMRS